MAASEPMQELAAKEKLEKYGAPVPDPDPEALARMKKEAEMDRETPGFLGHTLGMLKSGPDVSMAARTGEPNMTPFNAETDDTFVPLGIPAAVNTTGLASGVTAQTVTPATK